MNNPDNFLDWLPAHSLDRSGRDNDFNAARFYDDMALALVARWELSRCDHVVLDASPEKGRIVLFVNGHQVTFEISVEVQVVPVAWFSLL